MPAEDAYMLIDVRTTVRIEDALYKRVKARAVDEGRTIASVLEDAVRRGMEEATVAATGPVTLPTVDGPLHAEFHTLSYGKMLDLIEQDVPPEQRKAF